MDRQPNRKGKHMFWFQLLIGTHREQDGTVYKAEPIRDSQGRVLEWSRPLIHTTADLERMFGARKFRRVSDPEARMLLAQKGQTEAGMLSVPPSLPTNPESPVSVAAEKGAKGVQPSQEEEVVHPINYGVDLTGKFKGAHGLELRIFCKPGGRYTVCRVEEGNVLVPLNTDETLSKSQVAEFIKAYSTSREGGGDEEEE